MSPPVSSPAFLNPTRLTLAAPILLFLAIAIAFHNVPGNAFALDDWHTIEQNPWIRSLANIPRFFIDATTNSTVRENMDYRPVLQTTLAINYAISGISTAGLDSWHLTNILIHFLNSWCLFALARRLIGSKATTTFPHLTPAAGDLASLAAALLFAIHPTSAGVVNYISARSTSLTTLWVLLAIINYLAALSEPKHYRFALAWLFSILAVLTKIEGVTALGAVILAEFLLNPATRDKPLLRRAALRTTWLRLLPFTLTTIALIALWKSRTGILNISRSGADVTPLDYLSTQFRAWWYYLAKLFLPIHFIADYPTFPRTKFADLIALRDLKTLLAVAAWLLIGLASLIPARRFPLVTFCILSFFIFLAPHSSIIPLAEPVNEHRPYLPYIPILILLGATLAAALSALARRPQLALAGALILAIPLTALTIQRNRVWKSPLTLWGDTVSKAPGSQRAHVNYGYALATIGRFDEAERHYRESIRIAPGVHYAYTNLALTLANKNDFAGARDALDTAVRVAPHTDAPYYWRGQFRAQMRDLPGAAADFETSIKFCSAPFKELAAAGETLLRLNRTADAQRYLARGRAVNPAAFEHERNSFRPLLGNPDPMEQVADGMAWLHKNQPIPAEGCFREALRLDPSNITAKICVGLLFQSQRKITQATDWFDQVVREHPTHPDPFHFRGRLRASLRDYDNALADFRAARALKASEVRETAAIIETLNAMNRPEEAEAERARVDPVNQLALEQERTSFRDATRPR
jgi:tetratricopeptide (TPR) repeat protein